MLVAPLLTAGVSHEVAQELQMPIGPPMLDDVEERMPARLAILKDPGTPDRIVMQQHFPSQPWCKMCIESRGRDSSHREQSKIDAVVLQIACFLVGADTSSGAIHATMVPDSKNVDMPHVVASTAKWVRDLGYERFCPHGDKGVSFYWTKWQNVLRKGAENDGISGGLTRSLRKQQVTCCSKMTFARS